MQGEPAPTRQLSGPADLGFREKEGVTFRGAKLGRGQRGLLTVRLFPDLESAKRKSSDFTKEGLAAAVLPHHARGHPHGSWCPARPWAWRRGTGPRVSAHPQHRGSPPSAHSAGAVRAPGTAPHPHPQSPPLSQSFSTLDSPGATPTLNTHKEWFRRGTWSRGGFFWPQVGL